MKAIDNIYVFTPKKPDLSRVSNFVNGYNPHHGNVQITRSRNAYSGIVTETRWIGYYSGSIAVTENMFAWRWGKRDNSTGSVMNSTVLVR